MLQIDLRSIWLYKLWYWNANNQINQSMDRVLHIWAKLWSEFSLKAFWLHQPVENVSVNWVPESNRCVQNELSAFDSIWKKEFCWCICALWANFGAEQSQTYDLNLMCLVFWNKLQIDNKSQICCQGCKLQLAHMDQMACTIPENETIQYL